MFWSFCDEKFCYEEGEIDYEKQAGSARLKKMKASEVLFSVQKDPFPERDLHKCLF